MEVVSEACIIMQKIVVTHRWDKYKNNGAGGFLMSSILEAEIDNIDSSTGYIDPSFQPLTVANLDR